jgi:hypothetical protein
MTLLTFPQHITLPQLLHRVQLSTPFLPDESDDSESTSPNYFQPFKTADVDPLPHVPEVFRFAQPESFPSFLFLFFLEVQSTQFFFE